MYVSRLFSSQAMYVSHLPVSLSLCLCKRGQWAPQRHHFCFPKCSKLDRFSICFTPNCFQLFTICIVVCQWCTLGHSRQLQYTVMYCDWNCIQSCMSSLPSRLCMLTTVNVASYYNACLQVVIGACYTACVYILHAAYSIAISYIIVIFVIIFVC